MPLLQILDYTLAAMFCAAFVMGALSLRLAINDFSRNQFAPAMARAAISIGWLLLAVIMIAARVISVGIGL